MKGYPLQPLLSRCLTVLLVPGLWLLYPSQSTLSVSEGHEHAKGGVLLCDTSVNDDDNDNVCVALYFGIPTEHYFFKNRDAFWFDLLPAFLSLFFLLFPFDICELFVSFLFFDLQRVHQSGNHELSVSHWCSSVVALSASVVMIVLREGTDRSWHSLVTSSPLNDVTLTVDGQNRQQTTTFKVIFVCAILAQNLRVPIYSLSFTSFSSTDSPAKKNLE